MVGGSQHAADARVTGQVGSYELNLSGKAIYRELTRFSMYAQLTQP